MERCASHLRRTLPAALPLLLGALVGCTALRSQLVDPQPAPPDVADRARAALAASPLPAERQAQIAIEARGEVFIAVGYFGVDLPGAFTAELTAPFGVTLIEIHRDADGAEVVSAAPELQSALTLGQFPRLLGLWLLGDCPQGEVWQGANGVAIDCAANGPDDGLTWRIWVDVADGTRTRGELLRGTRLLMDYVCDSSGRCVLQDPVHGYALRVVPAR
jgi:hypothetical protein